MEPFTAFVAFCSHLDLSHEKSVIVISIQDIDKQKQEAALKSQLMAQEFQYNMQVKGLDAAALAEREQSREKLKAIE